MKRCALVFAGVLFSIVICGCGGQAPAPLTPAQQYTPEDIPARQVLRYMPASAHVAFAAPSVAALDKGLFETLQNGQLKEGFAPTLEKLTQVLHLESSASFGDIANAMGIDAAQPVAAFQVVGSSMGFVCSVKDPAAFEEKLAAYAEKPFSQSVLKTHWHSFLTRSNKARWSSGNRGLGFYIKDGHAFVATSQALLIEFLARETTPAPIAYGLGDYPGKGTPELVVLARLGANLDPVLALAKDNAKYAKVVMNHFAQRCDEATITLALDSGPLNLRLAMHEIAPAAAATLAPLGLHRFFPEETLALANIRISQGIKDLLAALSRKDAGLGDFGKQMGTANGIIGAAIGDEIAAGITGMAEQMPIGLVVFPVKNPKLVTLPLGFAGASKPIYTHQSIPVHKVEKYVPFPIYVGIGETVAFVSTQEEALKQAIDRNIAEATASETPWVAAEILEGGPYGFATWNPEGVQSALKDISVPALARSLSTGSGDIHLTLNSHGGWRQATLTVADFAGILKNVLAEMLGVNNPKS